jgi:hypothetical protein
VNRVKDSSKVLAPRVLVRRLRKSFVFSSKVLALGGDSEVSALYLSTVPI